MKPIRIRSQLTVRDTDPLVREHRVHDIHILPGVSMLDAIYKTLASARIATESVVLRNILFHEPVVTHTDMDRALTVVIDMHGEQGQVTINSVPARNDCPLSDDATLHMTCDVHHADDGSDWQPAALPVGMVTGATVDLDACYSVTRHIGIFHDSFMKCLGNVATLADGSFIGHIALGQRAAARSRDFMLHPVLLDCSTIVPLFSLRERLDEIGLFIPFAIEEVRARPLTGHDRVQVLVKPAETWNADQEILRYSPTLYDMQGRVLLSIRNFGVKRVRSLGGIQRLVESGTSARHKISLPGSAIITDSADKADALQRPSLIAMIGALIAQYGNLTWQADYAQESFFDLGLDSLALLDMSEQLEKDLGIRLYPTLLFECPTAAQLAAYLEKNFAGQLQRGDTSAVPVVPQDCHEVANSNAKAPQILVPRWMPLPKSGMNNNPAGKKIVLLSTYAQRALADAFANRLGDDVCYRSCAEDNVAIVADFGRILEDGLSCDEVWLVGGDHQLAFALLKILIKTGALQFPLALRAFTVNAFAVHHEAPDATAGHGIWGLWQSLSREYPDLVTSLTDLDLHEAQQAISSENDAWWACLMQRVSASRGLRALRHGRLYERRLLGVHAEKDAVKDTTAIWRQGGVYIVIGGAGGVGMEFVHHLRSCYAARVAVIGRSALQEEVHKRLLAEGEYGEDILYLQASVDDEAALWQAIQKVRSQFGGLHGIVHSAMVLDDRLLADMDTLSFSRVLLPKVAGAQALAAVTEHLDLDFLLFFSSMQSFVGNVSQANYAAASTFLDGFAASLRACRPYPVTVINWGFWSEVGAVANDVYRQLLARQGVYGLHATDALAMLEQVMAAGWEQALIVAAEEHLLETMGVQRDLLLQRDPAVGLRLPVSLSASLQISMQDVGARHGLFADTQQAMQKLLTPARQRVVHTLRELGVLDEMDAPATVIQRKVDKGEIAREHAQLVRALLQHIEISQVSSNPGSKKGMDAEAFADAVAACTANKPLLRDYAPLLQASLTALPAILGGKLSAAEVLFPNGSPELVRAVYGESEMSLFYNQVVAETVLKLANAQPQPASVAKPVRILEIGAGTGATTVEVLRALAAAGIACEYRYTDLWDKLVNDARERLGPQYPELSFGFLDIGTDPLLQGLQENFDIVVATNVLHATRDLHRSLRHVKRLLRPGGALVLNESVEPQEFSLYTFGLLPGWWSASDLEERLPDSPLASSVTWAALLGDEGFADIHTVVPGTSGIPGLAAQQVFVALSDGERRYPALLPAQRKVPVTVAAKPIANVTNVRKDAAANDLPDALRSQLRPYELEAIEGISMPRPRYLRLYLDQHDNPWLFLDSPPANTYTDALLAELCTTLHQLARKASKLMPNRLLYLSHHGEYFSLGGDRAELMQRLANGEHEALQSFADKSRELLRLLAALDAVVVAVVNGTAQGGGMETLLATDLQLVREGVKLGLPEIKSGLLPGMGGLTYLQSRLGAARTKRMVLLGELIGAREAAELGLISHVVDDPFTAALALPGQLPHLETSVRMKKILNRRTVDLLTADIDDWLDYLLHDGEHIDSRRITDSGLLLQAKSMHNIF